VVTRWRNEDLCLRHQPPKALGVQNAIAIDLKR